MEVLIPVDNMDFDFNSARSSPSVSAPSTPKRFGEYYCSAPTSPSHLSQFYRDFDEFRVTSGGGSGGGDGGGVPFDFAFDVSEESETASLSAEELFDGGVIKPLTLKQPHRLQLPPGARINQLPTQKLAGMNLKSPRGKNIFKGVFSPRNKKETNDPFEIAARNTTKTQQPEPERGRQRSPNFSSSSSRRVTRSLSPLRDSQYPWGEEFQFSNRVQEENISNISEVSVQPRQQQDNNTKHLCSSLSSSSTKSQKKWRFKDFFLFRSASEGRAADKDPLKKYTEVPFRRHEYLKNSSFRTIDSPGSGSGTRRRGPVSAHELHYTINRSVSEDLKKKTFLPYKQGILGRLSFNPAVHALANGFGFSRK
ncbi:unnamed protein product [Fraxinus pennsylvanica]|uniref:Uncharacterized protein n=1 Tax=Fraxinus pennsylvanica TaxID=56036 RepID=A0AAD2AJS8_9LAMI|nr:unnamed protein product [Fraxinus pennsylvanica]